MSTSLTQTNTASHPDHQGPDGIGMCVSLGPGCDCQYVGYDHPDEITSLHLKLQVSGSNLSDGEVVFALGLDAADQESVRLKYDAVSETLHAELPGDTTLNASMPASLTWHLIELAILPSQDTARLWINGRVNDDTNIATELRNTKSLKLGALQKQSQTNGDLYLDNIVLADSYTGPTPATPASQHADDPSRWLVIYNTADPESYAWAEAYRLARNVPYANLLGLTLPTHETINVSEYQDLANSIESYLLTHELNGQIMGLLLGYRVPGYVDFSGTGTLESIPSLLQTNSASPGHKSNPNSYSQSQARLTAPLLQGDRITARIDAADIHKAVGLINRATELTENGLGDNKDATLFFDPFVGDTPAYQTAFQEMIDWSFSLERLQTKLLLTYSGDPTNNNQASFSEISDDGFFWGWSDTLPIADIFGQSTGRRALCAQICLTDATGPSARATSEYNWITTAISANYAAVIASSRNNPIEAIPDVQALFAALTHGWTLAEAWHAAQPRLREGFFLIGDPLMAPRLPQKGLDIFGPLNDINGFNPQSPTHILREDASPADINNLAPNPGQQGLYVIQRSDAEGRREHACTVLRIANHQGSACAPPTRPAWPGFNNWPVVIESSQARVSLLWPGPFKHMNSHTVELISQTRDLNESTEQIFTPDPLAQHLHADLPIPQQDTRYRWAIKSPTGVTYDSPWSAWVEPAPVATKTLMLLGGHS